MRKKIAILLWMLLIGALTSCGQFTADTSKQEIATATDLGQDTTTAKAKDSLVVRVGDQPSFFLLKVAEEKGFFEEEFGKDNVEIKVTNFVNQGPAIVEAIAAGDVDLAILGTLPIVTANSNNNEIVALSSANFSENGFGLVVTKESGITSVEDLKDKVIATQFGTNEHQMLIGLLDNANISADEVQITNMSASDALNAFITGDINGGIFKGHQIQGALNAEGIQIADNSETGMIINCIVGRKAFIKEYPEITSRFLKVIDRSQKYIEDHVDETIQIVSDITATDIADTTINFESRDRLVSIDEAHFLQPLRNALQFAFKQELIDEEIKIEDIIDTSYYKASGIEN